MARKPTTPAPRQTIVVSNHAPKITIRSHAAEGLRVTIPGYHRATLALAHAIVSAFLADVSEYHWSLILAPRIDPGDRLMSCTVITIDMIRRPAGPPPPLLAQLTILSDTMRDATARVCRPLTGTPTHTVTVEE